MVDDENNMWSDLLEGLDDIYDNTSSGYEGCCDWGDVCDLKEGMQFQAVFIPVLYSVTFIVGVLGNGVLLGVLFRSRKAWSVTDAFILNLGVADVMLLLTLPFYAIQAAQDQGWTFGTPLCKITGAVFTVSATGHVQMFSVVFFFHDGFRA